MFELHNFEQLLPNSYQQVREPKWSVWICFH